MKKKGMWIFLTVFFCLFLAENAALAFANDIRLLYVIRDRTKEIPFWVDSRMAGFSIMLFYSGQETDLEVSLKGPDNAIYPMQVFNNEASFNFFTNIEFNGMDDASVRGKWVVVCRNKTNSPISFTFRINRITYLFGYDLSTTIINARSVILDASKDPAARIRTGVNYFYGSLANIDLKISIVDPHGKIHNLVPRDDGIAPDRVAGDGGYAVDFYFKYNGNYSVLTEVNNIKGKAIRIPHDDHKDVGAGFGIKKEVTENFERMRLDHFIVINGQ